MHHKVVLADGRSCHAQNIVRRRHMEIKIWHQKIIDVRGVPCRINNRYSSFNDNHYGTFADLPTHFYSLRP